jgi:hypothetical protein
VTPGEGSVDLGVGVHPHLRPRRELAEDPGGHARREHPVGDLHRRRHHRPAGDEGAAADDRAVEHRRAVADQGFRADHTAVHNAQMPDGGAGPDLGDRVVAAMQDRTVLDIRPPPHDDRPEVGPQYRPVPDGGLVLHPHVTDQGGRRRDPCPGADLRLVTLKREQWHPPIMSAGSR